MPTDPIYQNLNVFQKTVLLMFFQKDRSTLYESIGKGIDGLLASFNPAYAKALRNKENEDEGEGVNVFYDDDVERSDNTDGEYKMPEGRKQLLEKHLKKLKNNDPSMKIIGNDGSSSFGNINGT